MVNLLTHEARRHLTRRYYARILTVLLGVLCAAFVASAVLLLPTYFFIHAEADQAATYVAAAGEIASQRAKGASQETLSTFHESVTLLTSAHREPSYARILSLLTEQMTRGVALNAIKVTYKADGNATVSLSGVARTRAELIAYTNELKKVSEFRNIDIPVGDLVADVDSEFSVTLTWQRPKKL